MPITTRNNLNPCTNLALYYDYPCPSNIQELLDFLPKQHKLHPQAINFTTTTDYTPLNPPPPPHRFISSQLYPDLVGNLKEFISGVVNDHGLGEVPCQEIQTPLNRMARMPLPNERDVSEYGGLAARSLEPVVEVIAAAAGLVDPVGVEHIPLLETDYSQTGDFSLAVVQQTETESGNKSWVPIQVCSDKDEAYSVLLSEAEALSGSLSLDATTKQTGAKAMVVKLALQMANANAEFGLFFAGYLAIVAQLVTSTDPTCPGLNLHLSPVFKLQNEVLPLPTGVSELTPFQASIRPESFLAILAAMLCAKLVPGHSVKSPPKLLSKPLFPEPLQDVEEDGDEDEDEVSESEEDTSRGGAESSGVPPYSVQVATNAMMLRHPWFDCSDIHRIFVIRRPLRPLSESGAQNALSPMQPRNLLRAPRTLSKTVGIVTLVEQILTSEWSSIYTCRVENDEKPRIMKLVSELHSAMVLRELYMYEVALKDRPLVPKFYGASQRPVGGCFAFLLENVGDNLEEAYGSEWSDVKGDVSATEWEKLIDSVKMLHSLGVIHGDLEPRNVAQATDGGGFKFFDFGRSEMHQCEGDECGELRDLVKVKIRQR